MTNFSGNQEWNGTSLTLERLLAPNLRQHSPERRNMSFVVLFFKLTCCIHVCLAPNLMLFPMGGAKAETRPPFRDFFLEQGPFEVDYNRKSLNSVL